jgi:hypothetical protein
MYRQNTTLTRLCTTQFPFGYLPLDALTDALTDSLSSRATFTISDLNQIDIILIAMAGKVTAILHQNHMGKARSKKLMS